MDRGATSEFGTRQSQDLGGNLTGSHYTVLSFFLVSWKHFIIKYWGTPVRHYLPLHNHPNPIPDL